jgi:hypothetical protein
MVQTVIFIHQHTVNGEAQALVLTEPTFTLLVFFDKTHEISSALLL